MSPKRETRRSSDAIQSLRRWSRMPQSFYRRETVSVARELLGMLLVHDAPEGRTAGLIVETEAYLGERDPASHSYGGRTKRNAAMFGPPGHAYVYLIYGVHHCFNVVTGPAGVAEAVLLRALEPVLGLEHMRVRRRCGADSRLCNGPGNLVRAMGLGPRHDGVDLVRGEVGIWAARGRCRQRDEDRFDVSVSPRIGISQAAHLPLRFFITQSPWVSGPRRKLSGLT